MLMFNQREPIDLQVREPSVEPCWIDSLDESRSSFFSAIERMHGWFEFMSDQIIRLKSMANITPLEVSRYGKTKHFQTKPSNISSSIYSPNQTSVRYDCQIHTKCTKRAYRKRPKMYPNQLCL